MSLKQKATEEQDTENDEDGDDDDLYKCHGRFPTGKKTLVTPILVTSPESVNPPNCKEM